MPDRTWMISTLETRLQWTFRLVGIGLLSGMLLSWKLWHTDRLYPLFPVWEWIPQLPQPLDLVFLILFLTLIGWLIIRPDRRVVIAVLVCMILLALQDQSRWQPWFYQYALMLVPIACWKNCKTKPEPVLGLLAWVIIMVYAWGGIHKCQPGWMSVWENSLTAPVIEDWRDGFLKSAVLGFGYVIPVIEILMAIALCFRRSRLPAIVLVLCTHVVILLLLGPAKGYISNSVVWPWNLVMMAMVLVLFFRKTDLHLFAWIRTTLAIPGWAIFILVTLAPVFFYAGLWDRYLSFSLYAGQQKRYLVRIDASAAEKVPPGWSDWVVDMRAVDGHLVLAPATWSSEELNVPLVSEWRVLRSFSRKLCEGELAGTDLVFFVDYRHFPDKPREYFRCNEIVEMGRR
ncbi:MAG: hypothetical protein KJT03_12005 [Verrucomicrobiae bacterium]|nr:hypothetical protein [Verrucomicrobiae bacterium]